LSTQRAARRWANLGVLGLAILLLHLLAFGGAEWAWPTHEDVPGAATLRVRVIDPAPALPSAGVDAGADAGAIGAVVLPVRAVEPPPAEPVRPRPVRRAPPQLAPAPLIATPVAEPAAERAAPTSGAEAATATATTTTTTTTTAVPAPSSPVEALPGLDRVPRYRTEMPPAITLYYVMQRGALRGTGEFSWRPEGEHYELRLDGRVAGLNVLTQTSAGGFDAAGIAPLRFTDQRLRRGTKAANFQREAGKITFSGPASEFALREGVQDRLSWMVQLGAIVAAEPHLRRVDAQVVLYVVGANGDASVWTFDCVAIEPVTTEAGTVQALKFVREPREPYDTQVQVWIDPARHYLPVRATQRSGANDEGFELRLRSVDAPR
jgi:hypothetical protein